MADASKLEPLRFREFLEKYEALGLVSTYMDDPVDGSRVVALDWHDVSKLMQHYEAEIKKLEELIDRSYTTEQGISGEPGEHHRGGIHD